MTDVLIPILIVAIILIILVISAVKIVPQTKAYVIERLGAYNRTAETGIHFIWPIIERVAKTASLKEQVVDFDPQPVITKDNVTMQIDTVVFFQITDPKLFAYGVENPIRAIENLTATTLRNIIGELELDHTLTSRDTINAKIRNILDEATDPWGIKINRVELKNIKPPAEIQDAMEKQMKAERERREAILRAEGEKESNILVAQGKKESKVLEAEAEKQATILRAEAEKEARIKKAEAEAEAILRINEAEAQSIKLINEAAPTEAFLTFKKLETFEKVSDGQATKIIIPSELQSVVGFTNAVLESTTKMDDKSKK
jgi:regulator of protease activity HflC (stomatin/prohibitin superfamily)